MSVPSRDQLGDRIKEYESTVTDKYYDPSLPLVVRLDGRSFSSYTRGLEKPYDTRLVNSMVETTKYLVEKTQAKIGYTQSDEITLIYFNENADSEFIFNGKQHKLTSVLAGLCSAKFALMAYNSIPEKRHTIPCFDARVFSVPSKEEAANAVLWRWFDARRNSISSLAQSIFSHKQLNKKSTNEMLELLLQTGVDWKSYPDFYKYGTFVQRRIFNRQLTDEELRRIPEQHRPDPSSELLRSSVEIIQMPPFNTCSNRTEIIFDGKPPIQR